MPSGLALLAATLICSPPSERVDDLGDPLPPGAVARFGTTRLSHPNPGVGLFSPDGKMLAIADSNRGGPFTLFEASTGRVLRRERGYAPQLVGFLADGRLVRIDIDSVCTVEQPLTGEHTSFGDQVPAVCSRAACSPDGKRLALVQSDHIVLLDERGKSCGNIALSRQDQVSCLRFSPDHRLLAVGLQRKVCWLFDCEQRKRVWEITLKNSVPVAMEMAFSPDARLLAIYAPESVERVDLLGTADGKTVASLLCPDHDRPQTIQFSRAGNSLRVGLQSGRLTSWNLTSLQQGKVLGEGGGMSALVFDPTGATAVMGTSGRICLVDARTGEARLSHPVLPPLLSAAWVGKTSALATLSDQEGNPYFWSAATGRRQRVVCARDNKEPFGGGDGLLVFSPDGTRCVGRTVNSSKVRVVDVLTGKESARLALISDEELTVGCQHGAAYSPDGRQLAVVPRDGETIQVWDLSTQRCWRTLRPKTPLVAAQLSWSADGRSLAAVDVHPAGHPVPLLHDFKLHSFTVPRTRPCQIWEIASEQVRHSVNVVEPTNLAFLPDGRRLIVTTRFGRILLLRLGSEEIQRRGAMDLVVTCLAVAPNGRWLAVGGDEGGIEIQEIDGDGRWSRQAHDDLVSAVSFSSDSTRLLSASRDGTALVWDVAAVTSRPVGKPSVLAKAWADLILTDGIKATRARLAFEESPAEAVAFLKQHLLPARPQSTERVDQLLRDLDSDSLATRRKAMSELATLGHQVEGRLRAALKEKVSLEVRRRLEELLDTVDGPVRDAELLRSLRGVEILEMLKSTAARQQLEVLSHGDAAARLTTEAKAALERLGVTRQ